MNYTLSDPPPPSVVSFWPPPRASFSWFHSLSWRPVAEEGRKVTVNKFLLAMDAVGREVRICTWSALNVCCVCVCVCKLPGMIE